MKGVLVEASVETVAEAAQAVQDGVNRLELCRDLSVGGLTPHVDILRAVRAAVKVPIHVLIRTRAGDFVYQSNEVAAMCDEIREARDAGADSVIIGALTREGIVDRAAVQAMRDAAGSLPVIGHRAIDASRNPAEAIEAMAALGVDRVLTSGGAPTAEEGIPVLRQLVETFGDRVVILAGGSVRPRNVRTIVEKTGVREVHFAFTADAERDRVRAVFSALSAPQTWQ